MPYPKRTRRNYKVEAVVYKRSTIALATTPLIAAIVLIGLRHNLDAVQSQLNEANQQINSLKSDLNSAKQEAEFYHDEIMEQHSKEDEAAAAKRRKAEFISNEVRCLADNIYNEAAFEPEEGQLAVATVTMNRVANKFYPKSVCGVVYSRAVSKTNGKIVCAFSWTCKPRHQEATSVYKRIYAMAQSVFFKHQRLDDVADALLYHADYIKAPNWADPSNLVATIGHHEFYKQ